MHSAKKTAKYIGKPIIGPCPHDRTNGPKCATCGVLLCYCKDEPSYPHADHGTPSSRVKEEASKYQQGPASLRLWTNLPGCHPVYVLSCSCGGEYRKLIHRSHLATTTFRCGKCSKHVEIFTEK